MLISGGSGAQHCPAGSRKRVPWQPRRQVRQPQVMARQPSGCIPGGGSEQSSTFYENYVNACLVQIDLCPETDQSSGSGHDPTHLNTLRQGSCTAVPALRCAIYALFAYVRFCIPGR